MADRHEWDVIHVLEEGSEPSVPPDRPNMRCPNNPAHGRMAPAIIVMALLREALGGAQPGDEVEVSQQGDAVVIRRASG